MKNVTPHKNNRKRSRNIQHLTVERDTVKFLRTVGEQEAFYFYEAIGKPTGDVARSLSAFLNKVKTVELHSLKFHLQRRDFQNWIRGTLGDSKLAGRLGRISSSKNDNVRVRIYETVENRIRELRKSSGVPLVEENSTVTILVPSI